jgi:hypothetical protein
MVYGPTAANLKPIFWDELAAIGSNWAGLWSVSGDFNAIQFRNEK